MTEAEQASFARDREMLAETLEGLRSRLEQLQPQLEQMQLELTEQNRTETASNLVTWLSDFYRLVQEVLLVQARARLEAVVVERIHLDSDTALRIALTERLDIMNARASLVDSYRLIAFNADALQADLDIVFSGDMRTARDNPLSFRAENSTLSAGLQFDAPFTRLLERNNYRQSLIDYQRDRRQFIQQIDGVHLTMRQTLRQLEELRTNLEIQRRAVAISIRRVDGTREDLNRPVPPGEPGQPVTQLGPTAALDLLSALSDLRSAQNNFMSVWLNYHASRMRLSRELGIMQLDDQGRWIDEPLDEILESMPEEIPVPPPLPSQWLEALRVEPPMAQPHPATPPAAPEADAAAYERMYHPPPADMQHVQPVAAETPATSRRGGPAGEWR
jgi:outer membrane protein TolC